LVGWRFPRVVNELLGLLFLLLLALAAPPKSRSIWRKPAAASSGFRFFFSAMTAPLFRATPLTP
jgi:hypothetical protein